MSRKETEMDDDRKKEYGDCYGCVHHRECGRLCHVNGQGIRGPIKGCPWRTYPWKGFHPDYLDDDGKPK